MKIRPSGLIADMSGKIGGSSFQRNSSGLYLKNWQRPSKTISQQSYNTHLIFSQLQKQWKLLSDEERLSWNQLSKEIRKNNAVSMPMHLSGINLFLSCNKNLYTIKKPFITAAPVIPSFVTYKVINFGYSPPPLFFYIYPQPDNFNPNICSVVYMSKPLSPGVSVTPKYMPFIKYEEWHIVSITVTDAEYHDVFNFYATYGKKYFVKIIQIDSLSGIASVPMFASVLVT